MFRRILVPIDFSPTARVSLQYAVDLARYTRAEELRIVHVFTPQAGGGDAVVIPPMGQLMEDRDQMLEKFVQEQQITGNFRVKHELVLGFAADEIVEQSFKADLIVMGSTGESDLLDQVFGSVGSAVAQRAHCPVLLVPAQSKFADLRHIVYASNSLSLSRQAVLKLMDVNEVFHARVHFLHINTSDVDKETFRGEREKLFAPLFSNPDPEFAFDIKELEADTLEEGMNTYIEAHPVQMAIMVTKQRGFWERFFHNSQTKAIVLSPEVPVMVFHLD
ncbi:MAG: universal stress protein [Saprospiraceae bacterium]